MSELFDKVVYKKKKFSDILEEIHKKNKAKDEKINILIDDLKPLIKTMNDASLLVPLIKEYLEIGVKNDDLLVKMAGIIQRSLSKVTGIDGESGEVGLSEDEIAAIEEDMKNNFNDKMDKLGKDVNKKLEEMNETKSVSKTE